MIAATQTPARAALPPAPIQSPPRGFTTQTAKENAVAVNRSGVTGLTAAFFEDQIAAATRAVRPEYSIGLDPERQTKPDLELPGGTLLEVKSGSTAEPMRFSVPQLENYRHHQAEEGIPTLYWFVWYTGRDRNGQRTTLAALGNSRGKRAVGNLHRHLTQAALHSVVLDATLVEGIALRLRDEVYASTGYPGSGIEKVGRVLRTVVDAALNGDRRGRSIVSDFAGGNASGWRRLEGALPLGGYGELFAERDAVRSIPVVGVLRAAHADRLIRDGGPLSGVFPVGQLPKHPYRYRRPADDLPF